MELLAAAVVKEENGKTGEQQQKRCKITTNSRLEVILIACQRNGFCKHEILESSCTRKETVAMDVLITFSRDHETNQNNE